MMAYLDFIFAYHKHLYLVVSVDHGSSPSGTPLRGQQLEQSDTRAPIMGRAYLSFPDFFILHGTDA